MAVVYDIDSDLLEEMQSMLEDSRDIAGVKEIGKTEACLLMIVKMLGAIDSDLDMLYDKLSELTREL